MFISVVYGAQKITFCFKPIGLFFLGLHMIGTKYENNDFVHIWNENSWDLDSVHASQSNKTMKNQNRWLKPFFLLNSNKK